ncbi:hypothetical protein Igag_0605 [Ignisphaera aggregans DSM 17230]|uniref:Uncharacterized protein n=1 Tax=Ignisphaera aggregans (strain DSM 17230 / JCM 13409 / AQ1.S1) TaxID=583356 RepID=E0SSG7_IGNAA|nr:hypothetical protein Igag_0605 [Ignisphaera aggregans DSM 17230]
MLDRIAIAISRYAVKASLFDLKRGLLSEAIGVWISREVL